MSVTSANTSLNQVPALHKWFIKNHVGGLLTILDYGCGKYDKGMNYLKNRGHTVLGYDPYNRPHWANKIALFVDEQYDVGLCANVLNVIEHDEDLLEVLEHMRKFCTVSYFSVYEGSRDGIGRPTKKGYQRNAKAKDYVNILKGVYDNVTRHGTIFTCI